MNLTHLLRAAALMSILIAGSCSTARDDGNFVGEDGAANHPIAVEPSYRDLKVQFAGSAGMTPDDAIKFDNFLADYRTHGNGSLGISVPNGAPANAAITYFAERAAATGISRDKILVSTHDVANGDLRVDVSYIAYSARAEACGRDWSDNLAYTLDNRTPSNFGCSVQHNIAAMVADPRDLLGPGPMGPVDTARRATVMDHYEKGEVTQADKRTVDKSTEQSAEASNVGQ
ncbi:MAG: CpaD family pilus assembly protein [Alphaproteobacteria bacterium]|nr:CpaD family pilus assembly protein [Alphaproteobacteria bacterium]